MINKAIFKGYVIIDDETLTVYVEQITRTNSGLSVMTCNQPEDAMRFQYKHEALTWAQIINLSNKEQGYPSTEFKAMKLITVLECISGDKENDKLDH